MKKKNLIILLSIICIVVLLVFGIMVFIGTSFILNFRKENRLIEEVDKSKKDNEIITYTKSFGTYKIPSSWVESKEHSTNSKFFYVLNGHENDKRPNNISINMGTNKYSSDEHVEFRTAIMRQLYSQVKGATINANGSTTDNGYIVYTFVIYESDADITTTQYYIVGDYKYILVHETVFGSDSKETDDVAKKIVNSFKWK